jgi:hypothetical protein
MNNFTEIKKIYIATLPNGYFGSSGTSWKSLDTKKISEALVKSGYVVIETMIDRLIDLELGKGDIVIYTSSDEINIRTYLKDVMYLISKRCPIIPNYESLLAHENKGFQQIYRQEKKFGNLNGGYIFDGDNLPDQLPYVYKSVTGAGSSGVSLVRSQNDLKKIQTKNFKISIKRILIKFYRKLTLSAGEFKIYGYRHKGFGLCVYQQFVDNLSHDYKVLIFGKRYFVLKRNVRKNDFRASGSGNFSFVTPPQIVLNFAKLIFEKINVPYISLDIAINNDTCVLIEYQALNFGPYTLTSSPGHYSLIDHKWIFSKGKIDLEESFSLALDEYIKINVF